MSWRELFIMTVSIFYIDPDIACIYFHATKVASSQSSNCLFYFYDGNNLGNLLIHSDSFLFKSITGNDICVVQCNQTSGVIV